MREPSRNSSGRVARTTTAGKLLQAVLAGGEVDAERLARYLGMSTTKLRECRDGVRALDLERQIVLAGVVAVLAPEHARLARRLHAQAQSALRVREGAVASHFVYPQTYLR